MADKNATEAQEKIIAWGKETLAIEAQTLLRGEKNLGQGFADAVHLILACEGKVVLCGLGKSGHIARKISSTLASTGTPSHFLHPSEALHGDLGIVSAKDVLICIAFGGETPEVIEVAKFVRRMGVSVISITGKLQSSLSSLSHVVLDGSVEREACPLNLAPTSSSTIALALGDALAVAVMKARGIKESDFANFHPGGSLGRRLLHVSDVMVPASQLVQLKEQASFHEILEGVTRGNYGVVAIEAGSALKGVITDGDLRRALLKHGAKALEITATEIMTKNPKTVSADTLAIDAVSLMEGKTTSLFVCDKHKKILGLVRMHDLLAKKIV